MQIEHRRDILIFRYVFKIQCIQLLDVFLKSYSPYGKKILVFNDILMLDFQLGLIDFDY